MSVCPNKSDPNYKAAVKAYGENQAKQMFIDNNYVMPKIFSSDNTVGNEFGKTTYPQNSTLSLLNEKPHLAEKIIDSLKRLFPEVVINKGGIVDDNGNYVKIPPGKKGMHRRSAFQSMVAWANDSYLETPPHEYAHHYIEMYFNTPIIQEGIKRYGSVEELATMMGRYYANKKMSSSFENWVNKFWNYIKALVGSPDINYQLAEAFASNKKLGAIEEGLATVNYQSTDEVRVRYEDGADLSSLPKEFLPVSDLKNAALEFLQKSGINEENIRDIGNKISDNIDHFLENTNIISSGKVVYSNIIPKRYLKELKNFVRNDINLESIKAYMTSENIGKDLKIDRSKTKSINSTQERDKIIKEIIDNKNFIKGRTKEGKLVEIDSGQEYEFYYNTKTGKDYKRLTTHLSDDAAPDKSNLYVKSALEIGTKTDNLVRDFFADNLKKDLSEYELGDKEVLEGFIEELKVIKSNMESRGEKVLANDIILFDDESGIAGTVDLLTYDKEGNFRIYDMKTMRGNQFTDVHYSGENKGQNKYKTPYKKGKLSNEEKHQRQLSGYKIMLNNTHGINAKTIGVLPIEVEYAPGESETTKLKSLKGFEHKAVDSVKDPTMLEFLNKESFPKTTSDGKKNFVELLGELENATRHRDKARSSLILQDGSFTKKDSVINQTKEDINNARIKKEETYSRLKFKPLIKFLKFVEKQLLPYQMSVKYIAKYLSGGEGTLLSKFAYKILNAAETKRNALIKDFNELLLENSFSEEYKNWSFYKDNSKSIDQLSTETFSGTDKSKDLFSVKLTKAEMLSVYLMSRQPRARKTMEKKGVILNDSIEGRDLKYNKEIIFSKETIRDIADKVQKDKELMKVVGNIDNALGFMGTKVAENFKKENGIELRLEDNYFPVIAGPTSFEQRKGKSAVNDFKSLNLSLGESRPIRLVDPIQVMNSYKVSSASYVALSLPLENIRKIIKAIESSYVRSQEKVYIESIKEVVNKLEDPTLLYSGQGEKEFVKTINKLQSNFAVAVLGMNVPVMLKQSVSYITAMEAIDSKHLIKAGYGTKFLPLINPRQILEAIAVTGVSKGQTKLPIEWDLDTNKGVFALMKKYSSSLSVRLDGLVNRELGEALMNQDKNDDIIKIPNFKKDGSSYEISKTRLMEGIRIFDAVTIANIWKAAEFEAEEKYGLSRSDTDVFNTHVAIRVEEIVSSTQPNFNLTDRSGLSTSQNPIARFFSMFSSATQKIAMLQIDGVIDFLQNPTKENKVKLIKRSANIMLTTGLTITTIDALKSMLYYGWDDDDDMFKNAAIGTAVNSLGVYYGIGQIARVVGSQIDDKPFYQTLQHPVEIVTQDLAMAISNLLKGNLDDAALKSLETTLKIKGGPLQAVILAKVLNKRLLEEK